MIRPITPVPDPSAIDTVRLSSPSERAAAPSFEKLFAQAVERVEGLRQDSQTKVDRLLNGEDQELHEVVLSGKRAELAFQYFVQVRNKVVQAYQEVMRMQM